MGNPIIKNFVKGKNTMLTAIRFAYECEYEAERYFEFGYFECVYKASKDLRLRNRAGN